MCMFSVIRLLLKNQTLKFPLLHITFLVLFYYIKAYTASAWCTKELNIGGTNLTHATYQITVILMVKLD